MDMETIMEGKGQEVSDGDNDDPSNSSSTTVDTMGLCFLCLIKVEPRWDEEPEDESKLGSSGSCSESSSSVGFFQCLSRFLEVRLDLGSLFSGGGGGGHPRRGSNVNVHVKLCDECVLLSEKFSELCQQLVDILKMIRDKLQATEENGLADQFRKWRSTVEVKPEPGEVKARGRGRPKKGKLNSVEGLRRQIVEKCSRKLTTLLPDPVPPPPTPTKRDVSEENWEKLVPVVQMGPLDNCKVVETPNMDLMEEDNYPDNDVDEEDDDDGDSYHLDAEADDNPSDTDWNDGDASDADSRASSVSSGSESESDPDPAEENEDSDMDAEEEEEGPEESEPGRTPKPKVVKVKPKPKSTKSKSPKQTKWIINSDTGKHKCTQCTKEFCDKKAVKVHYNCVHLNIRFQCEICLKQFRYKKYLRHHKERVHGEGDADPANAHLKCRRCKEVFSQKADLKDHQQNSSCGIARRAEKERQAQEANVSCELCDKTFNHPSRAKRHMNMVHLKVRNHVCEECGKGFGTPDHLKRHVTGMHLNLREHVCDICGKGYNRAYYLEEHKRSVHLKIRNHVCEHCGKGFPVAGTLQKHINLVHLRPREHACDLCPEKFHRKDRLAKHHRVVHLGIPKATRVRVYTPPVKNKCLCNLCGKGFTRNNDLKRHMNAVHMQLRPFQCALCPDVSFKRKRSLDKHWEKYHPELVPPSGGAQAQASMMMTPTPTGSPASLVGVGNPDTMPVQVDMPVIEGNR